MWYKSELLGIHAASVVFSLLLLVAAFRYPRIARAIFAALFAWACWLNWRTAMATPAAYLDYGDLAVLRLYRAFIREIFSVRVALIVGAMATCQGLIAAGLVIGRPLARPALLGAVVFLVAIAPLGVGSAFPSTLLLAAGALRLLFDRSATERPLWMEVLASIGRRRRRAA